MSTPEIEPYQPFPSFAAFAATEFDESAFARFADQLAQAKEQTTEQQLEAAVERATKSAAIDTGAIEGLYVVDRGFTMTVATEAAAWENIHLEKGEEVQKAIHDALEGYEFVLDLAAGSRPLTAAWLRQLHEVLCRSQQTYRVITSQGPQDQPLPLGEYKRFPNNPRNLATGKLHSYAPVSDTPAEVERLVAELTSDPFAQAHPAIQASYAHYAFVCVHPFADGNGRVARALASVYLYRQPGVPLVVFADQKAEYLDSLELADAGDARAFVRFISDRAIDTVRMVIDDLHNAVPEAERQDRVDRLRSALLGRGGLQHDEIDALGVQLLSSFSNALKEADKRRPATEPISVRIDVFGGEYAPQVQHLRATPKAGRIDLVAIVPAPASVGVSLNFYVGIAKPDFTDYDLALVEAQDVIGEFLIRDLHPTISATVTYRLKAIAEKQLWDLESKAAELAEAALRTKHYR